MRTAVADRLDPEVVGRGVRGPGCVAAGEDHLGDADDRTLVGRAGDGDVEAFTVIVKRYGPLMRGYVTRMLGSASDADDVVQDSLVIAWQKLDSLRDPGQLKSWLMTIARRSAVDAIRARRPDPSLDDVPEPTAHPVTEPLRQVEARSGVAALDRALAELPDSQRRCWLLREIEGLSYNEIAHALDLSQATVRGQIARARAFLVTRMEDWR